MQQHSAEVILLVLTTTVVILCYCLDYDNNTERYLGSQRSKQLYYLYKICVFIVFAYTVIHARYLVFHLVLPFIGKRIAQTLS